MLVKESLLTLPEHFHNLVTLGFVFSMIRWLACSLSNAEQSISLPDCFENTYLPKVGSS